MRDNFTFTSHLDRTTEATMGASDLYASVPKISSRSVRNLLIYPTNIQTVTETEWNLLSSFGVSKNALGLRLRGGYNYDSTLRFDGRPTAYRRSLRSQ